MASQTNEAALETIIEQYLIAQNGFYQGNPNNFEALSWLRYDS